MPSIRINDFITIKMCSTTLCVSMSITVERFGGVCSSNRASDATCGIYTYPLNASTQDWQSIHTLSHRFDHSLPSSAYIKTLKLLAPSSTNPIALCSLALEPNGLIEKLSASDSLPLLLCVWVWASVTVCDEWTRQKRREVIVRHCTTEVSG